MKIISIIIILKTTTEQVLDEGESASAENEYRDIGLKILKLYNYLFNLFVYFELSIKVFFISIICPSRGIKMIIIIIIIIIIITIIIIKNNILVFSKNIYFSL